MFDRDPGQGRSQNADAVPNQALHGYGIDDVLPLHQPGEDAGPAGLIEGLDGANQHGGDQHVSRLHPAQHHHHGQQHHHGRRSGLGNRHQYLGFETVRQDPANHVEREGRDRNSNSQEGQVTFLAGEIE